MPPKSPASPTRPNCDRSRFGGGMGLNVIACEGRTRDVNNRPSRIAGGRSYADGLSHDGVLIAGVVSASSSSQSAVVLDYCARWPSLQLTVKCYNSSRSSKVATAHAPLFHYHRYGRSECRCRCRYGYGEVRIGLSDVGGCNERG